MLQHAYVSRVPFRGARSRSWWLVLLLSLVVVKCGGTSGVRTTDGAASPNLDEQALARAVHERVNQARIERGLPALDWNSRLARIARNHSADMASENFFGHVNRQGQEPTDRAREAGFECSKQDGDLYYDGVGENLYMTTQYSRWQVTVDPTGERVRTYDWKSIDEIARETVDGWLSSQGHRANMLSRMYGSEGIGISIALDRNIYITENFC